MSRSPTVSSSEPDGLELRPTPRTTRLNRNALVLAALLGGAVIVAAAATLVANRAPIHLAREASLATMTSGDRFWDGQPDGIPLPAVESPPLAAPNAVAKPNVVPVSTVGSGLDADTQRRRERLLRARDAAPLVAAFRTNPGSRTSARAGAPTNGNTHPALLGSLGQALQPTDETLLQNNQAGKRAFLDESGLSEQDETNSHLVRQPISTYEVTAGMIVPALLVTQGSSDLPGLMTGRVRENVYDSATGRHLLIPQATTIVGVYDSVVTFGQRRLLVVWQRLIFPDGTKLNIGGMPGTDLIGAAGLQDQVNRHYKRVFGSALLLSVLTAGVTLSQEDDNRSVLDRGSTRDRVKDTLATALGQNLGEVGSEMIRREMNVQPTLQIRPGTRFNVFVSKDLIFKEPYLNTFTGGGLIP